MAQIEGSALVTRSIANEGITTLFGLAGGPIVEVMGYGPSYGVRPIGVRQNRRPHRVCNRPGRHPSRA